MKKIKCESTAFCSRQWKFIQLVCHMARVPIIRRLITVENKFVGYNSITGREAAWIIDYTTYRFIWDLIDVIVYQLIDEEGVYNFMGAVNCGDCHIESKDGVASRITENQWAEMQNIAG